ncbi:hypothetical protein [Pandoraea sputorum]|uniref:hypothetical protein n=1 Tax=Pandoraea sputorum TaxID=93222 RepID=UPI001780B4F8|nr:hypothetical protein [Pandoraea sputorum]
MVIADHRFPKRAVNLPKWVITIPEWVIILPKQLITGPKQDSHCGSAVVLRTNRTG